MQTAGYIWDTVLRMARREARGVDEQMMKRMCNEEYVDIASKTSWELLRTKFDLTLTAGGVNFPSNIIGIEAVKFADGDNMEYNNIVGYRESEIEKHQSHYRWSFFDYITNRDGAYYNWTQDVDNGDTTVVYPAGQAVVDYEDIVGEYIKIGNDQFLYEVTAIEEDSSYNYTMTFSPTYRGEDIEDADIQVRPVGSRKFRVIDKAENEVTGRTVTVHGWKMPDGLYDEHDVVLVDAESLWLATVIRMLEVVGRRERTADTFRRRLYGPAGRPEEGRLSVAINMNPDFASSPVVRDINNNPFRFGTRELYSGTRGSARGWFRDYWSAN